MTKPQGPMTETPAPPHLAYRPEIDGLRAIAVLAVVLYHFGLPGLGGGFVGVDVFFVFSGFLIGSLLWRELAETGGLHLGHFYLRRIRRLAPAFFAMTSLTILVGSIILLPFEFRELGKELIASTLWLSNVVFWRDAGYFDIGQQSKVLLHTWSLSVEEQFYLVFPIVLLIFRFNRAVLLTVLVLAWVASALACVALTPSMPDATFYLFPFRAWELLSGVLLAIWTSSWRGGRVFHPAFTWAGLALIAGAVALTQPGPGFPGWQALVPVAGAVLILMNGQQDNAVNRVLGMAGPVFVGRMSYSLYLWHWPVLVLSVYWRGEYANGFEGAAWLGLALILSILSWRFVERPFRKPGLIGNRALLAGAVLAAGVTLGVGALAYLSNGLAQRFSAHLQAHAAASSDFIQDWSRCRTEAGGIFAGVEVCPIGPEGPPQVIFWGDSHLRAMKEGVALLAEETGTPGLVIWRAGCPPLFGLAKTESAATPAQDAGCLAQNRQMELALTQIEGVRDLVFIGRWAYYAEGQGIGRDAHNKIALQAAPGSGLTGATQAELYAEGWEKTIATLAPHFPRIHVMRDVPEIPQYGSRDMARQLAHGHLTEAEAAPLMEIARPEALARAARAEAPIMALAEEGRIALIDPWPILCPDMCRVMHDGQSWYFDNNHITNTAARAMREILAPAFAP